MKQYEGRTPSRNTSEPSTPMRNDVCCNSVAVTHSSQENLLKTLLCVMEEVDHTQTW